jgi:hypothetical protein
MPTKPIPCNCPPPADNREQRIRDLLASYPTVKFTRKENAEIDRKRDKLIAAARPEGRAAKAMAGKKRNGNGKGAGRRANRRGGNGNGNRRSRADQVLAQGAGATTRSAFGSKAANGNANLSVWDAKMPLHLSLPRAIGPYAVIRTTRRFSSSAACHVFGTFQRPSATSTGATDGAHNWTTICSIADVNAGLHINGITNANQKAMPMNGLGQACTICPSAFSVQIMNPGALGVTSGIVYAGTMNTQAKIGGRSESWDDYFDKYVEFQNPRLMTAGKLCLRGVQINSYPLNMSDLSDFTPIVQDIDGDMTYDVTRPEATGWSPIMVYNTGAPDGLVLEFLVTTEWRVRFDLDNPAAASHTHHPVSSDFTWDKLMRRAVAIGNGVRDIADVVASAGQMMNSPQARGMLAL